MKIQKHPMILLGAVIAVPIIVIIIFYIRTNNVTENQVNNFDECVSVGNPIMESYPRKCRAGNQTFVEKIPGQLFTCSEESRKAEACAEIYQPVCATVQVQCITTPCDALLSTYPNECSACINPLVTQYTDGECKLNHQRIVE